LSVRLDKRQRRLIVASGALVACLLGAVALTLRSPSGVGSGVVVAGEAREGAMTMTLPEAVRDIKVIEARVPGRPLVVIDAGHGGDDPGAPGVSGAVVEKEITLQLARELRDRLAANGRVRVALTRDGDQTLDLETRAGIARRIGTDLFVSIHADSAPNALARGATIYSVSEVASDEDAARFAAAQNGGEGAIASVSDGSVRALLADLAARDEMVESASFAGRLVSKSSGRGVELRPEPHRFAAFRVLRGAQAPAVLVEAGYLSNVEDEAILRSAEGRARVVRALADAIEAELAVRTAKR
jgi:N-acetylmuramoyl-L-alanine amidase